MPIYETYIDTTKAGFARLGRALILTKSKLVDSTMPSGYDPGVGVSATILVDVAEFKIKEFKKRLRPTIDYFEPHEKDTV